MIALFCISVSAGVDTSDHQAPEIWEERSAFFSTSELEEAVCAWAEVRKSLYSCEDSSLHGDYRIKISDDVYSDLNSRTSVLASLEQKLDCTFISVELKMNVSKVEYSGNCARIHAYEVDFIDYRCNGHNTVDRMGFGCEHLITIRKSGDGSLVIDRDTFDESGSTGFKSSDLADIELTETNGFFDDPGSISIPGMRTYQGSMNVNSIVAYAHLYCGVDNNTSTNMTHTSLWNPQFYYYYENGNADCANFVSQCLYEGGITMTFGGYETSWNSSFHTTGPQQGSGSEASAPWIGVYYFRNYWFNQGIGIAQATSANTFTGNPVYWLNSASVGSSGHLMICTGKNSAGIPLMTAHNGDVIDYPMTAYSSDHTLYTLFFRCIHSWIEYGDSYRCIHCGSISDVIYID